MEAVEASLCYFFEKLVDETQISKPPEATRHYSSIKSLTCEKDDGDGEKINKGLNCENKHEFVISSQKSDEKVDHKKCCQGKIDLK